MYGVRTLNTNANDNKLQRKKAFGTIRLFSAFGDALLGICSSHYQFADAQAHSASNPAAKERGQAMLLNSARCSSPATTSLVGVTI
jgi:hypothetical protein